MLDQEILGDERSLFRALISSDVDSIYVKDRDCRLIRVSRKMASDLGFADPSELVGKTDIDLFGYDFGHQTRLDDLGVMESGEPLAGRIESRKKPDGGTNWTITSKLPITNHEGAVIGLVGITREINEIRQTEVALQYLATHDTLTELPNRFLFTDRAGQLLARAARSGDSFAVLFLDLDRFKIINDTYGHHAGDDVLREVAARLSVNVRPTDTVARLGGDEFVVLLDAKESVAAAERVAGKIEEAILEPFTIAGRPVTIGTSIGISLYPNDGEDIASLLRTADCAMYLAKREGGNRHHRYSRSKDDPTAGEAKTTV